MPMQIPGLTKCSGILFFYQCIISNADINADKLFGLDQTAC